MARFDVYRNAGKHKTSVPFLLDIQSDHLDALSTRIVIPLRLVTELPKVSLPGDLNPVFLIEGIECFLDAPQLAAIPQRQLSEKVLSLAKKQASITNSLDRLFGAF
jgi:toxin CcdB